MKRSTRFGLRALPAAERPSRSGSGGFAGPFPRVDFFSGLPTSDTSRNIEHDFAQHMPLFQTPMSVRRISQRKRGRDRHFQVHRLDGQRRGALNSRTPATAS